MSSKSNNWYLPLSALFVVAKKLSLFLFTRGTWKSVEFEIPVLSVSTFMDIPAPKALLFLLGRYLDGARGTSAYILGKNQVRDIKRQRPQSGDNHLQPVCDRQNVFYASHVALGISELAMSMDHLNWIILGDERFVGVVRPKMRILAIDFQQPYYEANYWPSGAAIELKSNAHLASFAILYNVPHSVSLQHAKNKIAIEAGIQCPIGVVFEDEMHQMINNFEHKQNDQIINIKDHDTFEKPLIKIVEKVL